MSQPFGTGIIVINNQNQILLGKRKNAYRAGLYGLPGGRTNLGEKIIDGSIRELAEETSLQAKKIEFFTTVKGYMSDKQHNFIIFIFVCRSFTGTPQLIEAEKCEGWDWFDLDKLPKNILPGHLAGIKIINLNLVPKLIDI